MSTFTKTDYDDCTVYVIEDHGERRGWMRLDTDGCVHVTPGVLGHMWFAPEDGEPYMALMEHFKKFSGQDRDAIFGTPSEQRQAEKQMGHSMFRQPKLTLEANL